MSEFPEWLVMDERAEYDMDRAIVVECCDTREEAIEACKEAGFGVVVGPDNEIVFRYGQEETP